MRGIKTGTRREVLQVVERIVRTEAGRKGLVP